MNGFFNWIGVLQLMSEEGAIATFFSTYKEKKKENRLNSVVDKYFLFLLTESPLFRLEKNVYLKFSKLFPLPVALRL